MHATDPEAELPQDRLHACAGDLVLLHDLFCAASEADLALSETAIAALTRRLSVCARTIEAVADSIAPQARLSRAA
jgi:hypothetical protein